MEPVAFPLRLWPGRRPLLRRLSEDSNVCTCGPIRNDRARCVLGVDRSEQSLRRVYCTGGAGTTGSREGERRVDNDNSRRSPIQPEELAGCRIIATLVPTSGVPRAQRVDGNLRDTSGAIVLDTMGRHFASTTCPTLRVSSPRRHHMARQSGRRIEQRQFVCSLNLRLRRTR